VFIAPTHRYLSCLICSGVSFTQREVQMNTSGMTFMGLDGWNRSADGAICARCGFVHTFMGRAHRWVDPSSVSPEDLPYDPHGRWE
jgi:hypothetical protein